MESFLGILLIIVLFLAFSKGRELFGEYWLTYEGSEKRKFWHIFEELYHTLPYDPDSVFFDKNSLSITYGTYLRYRINFFIQYKKIKDIYVLSFSIYDSELAKIISKEDKRGNSTDHNFKSKVYYEFKLKREGLESNAKKILPGVLENYQKLLEEELQESYDKYDLK